MIEMLGVLAIVGVLSVGGIAGYSKAMEKFKINKTIDQISHLVTNIRTLYAQQTSYYNLSNDLAIKMNAIPDSLTTSNSYPYIYNAFNGSLQINGSNTGNYTGKYFAVSLNGLSERACIEIATTDWGTSSSSGFIGLTIGRANNISSIDGFDAETCSGGSYNLAYACPGNRDNPSPMSVARAAEACKNGYDTLNLLFQ